MAFLLPFPVRIISNDRVGIFGRILKLESAASFSPGQVVAVSRSLGESGRMYSISSAPGDKVIEIIYTLVAEGNLTPYLWNLKPGDTLYIYPPRGTFLDPVAQNRVWWICNGTGVSPYISMIRHARKQDLSTLKYRTLLCGFRSADESWFVDEIIQAGKENGLSTILCLSSPDAEIQAAENTLLRHLPRVFDGQGIPQTSGTWLHFGRLTAWPDLAQIPSSDSAMLCGSSGMISDVREILTGQGMPMDRIFAESYF